MLQVEMSSGQKTDGRAHRRLFFLLSVHLTKKREAETDNDGEIFLDTTRPPFLCLLTQQPHMHIHLPFVAVSLPLNVSAFCSLPL